MDTSATRQSATPVRPLAAETAKFPVRESRLVLLVDPGLPPFDTAPSAVAAMGLGYAPRRLVAGPAALRVAPLSQDTNRVRRRPSRPLLAPLLA